MKAKKVCLSRLLQIPVVYTTRLEQMGFMNTPITTLNISELFENIIQESKPTFKSLKGLKRGRPRRSKRLFNNLLAIINDINEKARITKEQESCAKTDVPLDFCEPTVHAKEIESKDTNDSSYEQLNSIITEIQKNLVISICPSFIIYLLIKDCHTVVSDIYVAKSGVSECTQDKDVTPESGKHVMTLDYCCWYDRKLKLELFFNYFLLNTPSFLYKPHDCAGVCNCCCSKLPHNNLSRHDENSSEECNNLNTKRNRILNLNSHIPSAFITNFNPIDKSLRCLNKSRELGTDLRGKESIVNPISVQLTDHCNKKIVYYEIGANGKIEEYLKSYNSEGVSNTRENAKLREDQSCLSENNTPAENQESVYCWFARQNIYSKLVLDHVHVCENTIAFLKTLPPSQMKEKYDNMSESPIHQNSIDNSTVVISITFRKEPTISRMTLQTYKNVKYDQTKNCQKSTPKYFTLNFSSDIETNIDSVAELVELAHNNSFPDEDEVLVEIIPDNTTDPLLLENDTIPITEDSSRDVLNPLANNLPGSRKYSTVNSVNDLDPLTSNMPGPSNTNQVDPDSCGSLINSILSKFKGIRLDLDEKGNVKLCNTIASVWSKEDSEILDNILKLAQREVNNLRMQSANATTVESPIVQTPQTRNPESGSTDTAENVCTHEKLKPPMDIIYSIQKTILDFKEYSNLIYDREIYDYFTKISYMHRVLAMKPPLRNIHRITLNSPGRKFKLKKIKKAKGPKKSNNVSEYVKSKSNTIQKLKTISVDEDIIANKDQPKAIERKKLRKISESSNSSGDSSESEHAVEISTLQWSTCSTKVQKDAVSANVAGDECNQTIPAVPLSLREKAHENFRLSLAKTTELKTNSNKTVLKITKRRRSKNPLIVNVGPTNAAISQVHPVKKPKGLANAISTPVSNNLLRQMLIQPSSRFNLPNTHANLKSTATIADDSVTADDDYIVVDDDDL